MHLSTDPTDPQNQEVYALWDRLAEFSVADGDAALIHLLSTLRTMLSVRNVLWGVVVRLPSPKRADPLLGWRPRLVRVLDPIPAVAASVQKQYDTLWSNESTCLRSFPCRAMSRSASVCCSKRCRRNGSRASTIGGTIWTSASPTAFPCVLRSMTT
ncbi:hypothetical protein ACVWZR_007632 [Bradyrhizobium sp. i1.3.1]